MHKNTTISSFSDTINLMKRLFIMILNNGEAMEENRGNGG
jgi:hypothetical protein